MKVALVTGAAGGIGQALVQILSEKGYAVYGGTHDGRPGPARQGVTYLKLDVQDDASIEGAVSQIERDHGRLDLLINNAGIIKVAPHDRKTVSHLPDLDRRDLLTQLGVNTVGPLMVIKQVVRLMTGDHAFIINISSDRSSYNTPDDKGNYGYAASKIALNMITHCLLHDLPPNVSTFAVHPGWVKTDMNPRGVIEPTEAATKIVGILDHWKPELNGKFLNNEGELFE